MRTERLYYNDSYLLEFDADVVQTFAVRDNVGIVLDRTAFYPTSGGQLNDVGTINDVQVLDCYEDENTGDVVHVLSKDVSSRTVRGRVDAERRKDHMQQHSGQHVLSQAFVELFGWPTVSFHMGEVTCTIDLPVESLERAQAAEAEDVANRIVLENRAVSVRYVASERIHEAGLRKPTARTGDIRVIDIFGYDHSACGGTHVAKTAEIGSILITGLQRAKRQTRVEFICGNRVLRYARLASRSLESISQTVSAPPLETAPAVRMLWGDLQQLRKRTEELESKLIDFEAAEFPINDGIARGIFENRGIESLKTLAVKMCARPNVLALLADRSDQLRVVFACSADSNVDCSALLKKVIERFGGKGGGRRNLAQAGGLTAENPAEVLEAAAELAR